MPKVPKVDDLIRHIDDHLEDLEEQVRGFEGGIYQMRSNDGTGWRDVTAETADQVREALVRMRKIRTALERIRGA
jgi:hypothetical protein